METNTKPRAGLANIVNSTVWTSLLTAALAVLPALDAGACNRTPPTDCSRSATINKIVPGSIILEPSGPTSTTLPVNLTITSANFDPQNSCPAPTTADVTIRLVNADGSIVETGTALGVPVTPGSNNIAVPIDILVNTERLCFFEAEAIINFSGGGTDQAIRVTCQSDATNTGPQTLVCLVRGVDGGGFLVPRLDMTLAHANPSEAMVVHPGSQATLSYQITNNDPSLPFTGFLRVGTKGTSQIPEPVNGFAPGPVADLFAQADLFGDAFPTAILDPGDPDFCILLPTNPANERVQTDRVPVAILPGQTITVEVGVRPWGLCNNGSCSESIALLIGQFDGESENSLACAGSAVVVDTSASPDFQCPDSGAGALADASGGQGQFILLPIDTVLLFNPNITGFSPLAATFDVRADELQETVRSTTTLSGSLQPGQTYEGQVDLSFQNQANGNTPNNFNLMPGAPSGFGGTAPYLKGTATIPGLTNDIAFEFITQLSAWIVDGDSGQWVPVLLPVRFTPSTSAQPTGQISVSIPEDLPLPANPQLVLNLDTRVYGGFDSFFDIFVDSAPWNETQATGEGDAQVQNELASGNLNVDSNDPGLADGVLLELLPREAMLVKLDPAVGIPTVGDASLFTWNMQASDAGTPNLMPSLGIQYLTDSSQVTASFPGMGAGKVFATVYFNGQFAGVIPDVSSLALTSPSATPITVDCLGADVDFKNATSLFVSFADMVQVHAPDGRLIAGTCIAFNKGRDLDSLPTVPIEMVALSLRSTQPITVTGTEPHIGTLADGDQFTVDSFFDITFESDPIAPDELNPVTILPTGNAEVRDWGDGNATLTGLNRDTDSCAVVPIEMVALSLRSVEPIVLGNTGEIFEVELDATLGGVPGRQLLSASFENRGGQIAVKINNNHRNASEFRVQSVLNGVVQPGTVILRADAEPQDALMWLIPLEPGSPGITALGAAPSNNDFQVDSFFDIIYNIEFQVSDSSGNTLPAGDELRITPWRDDNDDLINDLQVSGPGEMLICTSDHLMPIVITGTAGTSPPAPQIAGIFGPDGSPLNTVQPGDVLAITGSGFGNDPDDICLIAMLDGANTAFGLEVMTATPNTLTATMLPLPTEVDGQELHLMVGTGTGDRQVPDLAFPDVVVEKPIWAWEFTGQDNEDTSGTANTVTASVPAPPVEQVWIFGEQVDGEMCIELVDDQGQPLDWGPSPVEVQVNARLRDHDDFYGYDQFAGAVRLPGGLTPQECAERICDVITCSFFQQTDILVDCRVDTTGPNPVICLGFGDGEHTVDWGTLQICLEPVDDVQVATVTPQVGTTGDIVTIEGIGFGENREDLCVVGVPEGATEGAFLPFEVLGATDTRIVARVGHAPDGFTGNVDLMIARGDGALVAPAFAFDDIELQGRNWAWTNRAPVENNPAAGPNFGFNAPVDDPDQDGVIVCWTSGGPMPQEDNICVDISRAEWEATWNTDCKIRIEARIHGFNPITGDFVGNDSLTLCASINNQVLSFEDFMARLCDIARCTWVDALGVDVPCEFTVDATTGTLCISLPDGYDVTFGNLTVCIECPPGAGSTPTVTDLTDRDGDPVPAPSSGDVVEIRGTGFGSDPDDLCTILMEGDNLVPIEIVALDLAGIGVIGPIGDNQGVPHTVGVTTGFGERAEFAPLFPEITVDEPVWVWQNDPRTPDVMGPEVTPQPQDPPSYEAWYFNEPIENGKLCIFIPGNQPDSAKVTISGRMRDHTTGLGYDQFAASVNIDGSLGLTAVEFAQRICDILQCSWSQLAGVDVICEVEPFGTDMAKITLSFGAPDVQIDWGAVSVCIIDLEEVFNDTDNNNDGLADAAQQLIVDFDPLDDIQTIDDVDGNGNIDGDEDTDGDEIANMTDPTSAKFFTEGDEVNPTVPEPAHLAMILGLASILWARRRAN